ncbi:MAG: hypothetical protein FJ255_01880 [Phycisphaerae bacterium]|nr:hypothetical protein [Phycisphaerae bacterium]
MTPRSLRPWRVALAGTPALVALGVLAAAQPPPAPPAAGVPSRTCAKECHQEILGHRVMHGPAANDCQACHVQGNPEEHKFYLITAPEQLCARCHTTPHKSTTHAPFKEGKCHECHDPHGAERPRMLVADPNRDLCTKCHQEDFTGLGFVHGPVAVGACIICHEAHTSSQPRLLNQEPRAMCLSCHGEVAERASGPGMHRHVAIDEGCTRCHDPHASKHKYQLRDQAPGLCLSCHSGMIDHSSEGSRLVHGALTAESGCTACHEPHASTLPSLQRSTQPGMCLGCHDRTIKASDGTTLTNMAALLDENPYHHGPIREGVCTACHESHRSDHFRLLVQEYPPQFYAKFEIDNFKLCFQCHQAALVQSPSGAGLTEFRDGDRNLHHLHVNQEKGRTCRACHEVHASKRPAHVREAVPFGNAGWMLEINFQATAAGGSCAPGCHQPASYTRGPALAAPTPPPGPTGVKP